MNILKQSNMRNVFGDNVWWQEEVLIVAICDGANPLAGFVYMLDGIYKL